MTDPKIDAIGIAVSDMAVSVAFYRRLGLDFPAGCESEPHAEADLGPSMRLMLDTEAMLRQIDPDWTASPAGRVGLAVRLPSPEAVDELYDELAAVDLGARKPWDAFWGQRYAVVRDPDGMELSLYAQLPDSDQSDDTQ